ncbi:MAG: ribosome silencing factor [Candidatus Helarchaeota archaeon]|nr:ribosome silencing factor [Candidatus Helarchaeota archaeon]
MKRSNTLAKKIANLSLSKKAEDVIILDVRELTTITDFFVICSGNSDKQVKAIVDVIIEELEKFGVKPWHKEGYQYLNWVLLDYIDVVVHIFQKDTREYYSLERLWGDAEIISVSDEKVVAHSYLKK